MMEKATENALRVAVPMFISLMIALHKRVHPAYVNLSHQDP